jgi:ferredoxin-NADP reductase
LPLRWDGEADTVRSLRVVDKIRESDDVTSFVLQARDGGALPEFESGQHLPVELAIEGLPQPVRRTYSLSNAPGRGRYRITVKREPEGFVSRLLHDQVDVGAFVSARRPAGDFVLEPGDHPAVLVSAGVGLTPMVSMLHTLADPERAAPVWFFHGARDGAHHALKDEVRRLTGMRPGITTHVRYSQPRHTDVDHDEAGRLDGAAIAAAVDRADAHYYLCGPASFMATIQSSLEEAGVAPERIHSESFGPR